MPGDNATPIANGGVMGWLYKKGKYNKAWKLRYAALYNGVIYYFSGHLLELKGTLPLKDFVDVHQYHETNPPDDGGGNRKSNGRSAFQLQTKQGGRVFRFCADSKFTCETWVESVQRAMEQR